jgi:hypothetical protein
MPKINRTTRDINHQLSQNGAVIQMFNNLKTLDLLEFESKLLHIRQYKAKNKFVLLL